MFRSLARLPLRTCRSRMVHTVPKGPPPNQGSNVTLVLALGVTIAALTQFSSGRRIELDAPSPSK